MLRAHDGAATLVVTQAFPMKELQENTVRALEDNSRLCLWVFLGVVADSFQSWMQPETPVHSFNHTVAVIKWARMGWARCCRRQRATAGH